VIMQWRKAAGSLEKVAAVKQQRRKLTNFQKRRSLRLLTQKSVLALLLTLTGCRAAAESYCEVYLYSRAPVTLSIPEQYYAFPRSADSTISLMLRYSDLAAPERLYESYDPGELAKPNWRIDASNYTALLQIYRHDLKRPSTAAEFKKSYPRLAELVSDWPGWTKLKGCLTDCQQVFYISDNWSKEGIRHVLCYEEVAIKDPLLLSCRVYDTIEGLHAAFSFPAAKKEHFAEFRERIAIFVRQLIEAGSTNCELNQ
jgi:hypothetical protein